MGAPVYNNFQNLITFSRGSNATLFDSTGKLTFGPNNQLVQSSDFTATANWLAAGGAITRTPSQAGPTGALDAVLITDNATTTSNFGVRQTVTSAAGGGNFIFTATVKYRDYRYVTLNGVDTVIGNHFAYFDIQNGVVVGTPLNLISSGMYPAGNGYYTCYIVFNSPSNITNIIPYIIYTNSPSVSDHVGVVGTGTFLAASALSRLTYETTPRAADQVTTTASQFYGPRLDYDPVTLALRGMLVEESRINLAPYSNTFTPTWSAISNGTLANNTSETISPDGTNNASKITRTSLNTAVDCVLRLATSQAVSSTYTLSVFAKAATSGALLVMRNIAVNATIPAGVITFALDGTNTITQGGAYTSAAVTSVGNGWYRCTVTGTTPGTIAANFIDIGCSTVAGGIGGATGASLYLYGAQLELGAFATSLIPTGASSVTRNADVASMSGSQFAPWYNGTQGTIVVAASSFVPSSDGIVRFYAVLYDGVVSYANAIRLEKFGTAFRIIQTVSGSGNLVAISYVPDVVSKIGDAYAASNSAASVNGGAAQAIPGSVPPGGNLLGIGSNGGGGNIMNGHIRSITYYPYRLTNAQLQGLTA